MSAAPTLEAETRLLRAGHATVAGIDEVGRGALAGPVSVGVVVVDAGTGPAPARLRDSKLLSPAARDALVPALRSWALAWAVGHAEPDEVDGVGVVAALRLAGWRALASLPALPSVVLLDGSHDWLTRRERAAGGALLLSPLDPPLDPPVTTQVKADLSCAAVAAASVLAKTERDALMTVRSGAHPDYGWAANKGYAAPAHVEALRRLGPCAQHRRSWRLPIALPSALPTSAPTSPASSPPTALPPALGTARRAGVHDGPR